MSFFKSLKKLANPVDTVKSIAKNPGYYLNPIAQTKAMINNPSSLLTPNMLGPMGAAKLAEEAKAAAAQQPQPGEESGPSQNYGNAVGKFGSFATPFSIEDFYKNQDPGYQFRMQQGQQGLMNSAAAGSGSLSGSAMKDLIGYNQGLASTEYGNAYNRYQTTQGNIFSRLQALAGLGQASAGNVAANGTALAGQASQATQNQGTAAGAGIVGVGNAIAGGLSDYGAYKYANQSGGITPAAYNVPQNGGISSSPY